MVSLLLAMCALILGPASPSSAAGFPDPFGSNPGNLQIQLADVPSIDEDSAIVR